MSRASRLLTAALFAAVPWSLAAQLPVGTTRPSAATLAARVDSLVNVDILALGFPSVSIVVKRGPDTLLERAWGVADVGTGQKADLATTYRLGSISKQFTAALILKLVDRGKLRLTDSVGRHLTPLRPEWRAITIEQLLNHTSGLPRDFHVPSRMLENLPGDSLLAMAAQDTLVSTPGAVHDYSNTGYMFLGVLVEKLYRTSYAAALRNEITGPLKLSSTGLCDAMDKAHASTGYVRGSEAKLYPPNEMHVSQNLGAGTLCATARDLAIWNRALHGGRVLSSASYIAMTTPRGAAIKGRYGFGLYVRPAMWGGPAMVHEGATHGFSSQNGWYPADSLSVTLLYNARPRLERNMADVVGMIAQGGTPAPPRPTPVVTLPIAATQGEGRPKIVGAYEQTIGQNVIVTFEEGTLYITPPGSAKLRLFLLSGTTYAIGSAESAITATFVFDVDGDVTGIKARQSGTERNLRKIK